MRRLPLMALATFLALAWARPGEAVLIDAVVGAVGSTAVTASDIALARALGLFGFTPSEEPIGSADVDQYGAALVAVLEAHLRWHTWKTLHEGLTIETPGAAPETPGPASDLVVRNLLAPQQPVALPFAMPPHGTP
jgi:hypothetical protein